MFRTLRTWMNSRLFGLSLVLLIIAVAVGLKLPWSLAATNSRRPGDGASIETPAVTDAAAPVTLREFSSPDELTAWTKSNVDSFNEQDKLIRPAAAKLVPNSVWDCDDYAERLQRKALSEGYLVSLQLISNGSLLGAKVTNYISDHMGNITIIDNSMYYIEPMDGHIALIGPKY